MAKWLWLLISTAVYYPVISLLCPVRLRALYGAHETSEVLLVGMPGVFLRYLSFCPTYSYVIGGEISKMV